MDLSNIAVAHAYSGKLDPPVVLSRRDGLIGHGPGVCSWIRLAKIECSIGMVLQIGSNVFNALVGQLADDVWHAGLASVGEIDSETHETREWCVICHEVGAVDIGNLNSGIRQEKITNLDSITVNFAAGKTTVTY